MSYILEALKKAQAERQLGSAPTIHALPIQAPAALQPASNRLPMLAGAGVALVGAGAFAVYALREPAPVAAPAPAPVSVAATPVVLPPVAPPPVVQASPAPPPVVVQAPPAPPAPVRVAPPPKPVVAKAPAQLKREPPPPPAAPVEEHLPTLRELPEAIQREMPRVTFGGYIYAKNPADSLLLVDKSLRREGEEVAAGLVLEKLQSKSAIMNYRGTRYRVPY